MMTGGLRIFGVRILAGRGGADVQALVENGAA